MAQDLEFRASGLAFTVSGSRVLTFAFTGEGLGNCWVAVCRSTYSLRVFQILPTLPSKKQFGGIVD